MIPHKNLFSGALGKLQNIGGSRIYTTPHTVSVPAEHSINVTYNVQGDLVGHSLDGRLWLYRRSRRLGIIALKWNAEKGELEYASGQNISGNDDVVLACGLDWVLTNNNIFMVTDEEPYIRSARLFDANIPDIFLYSILRAGNIGDSGIDPFTGEAWGKREDNGNSEGTGYFSKSTHLLYPAGSHSFEQCYSLLHAVGDWQIFENFLVRRPDAESINSYNYMQNVRPLIPLEFNNGTAAYGTGYNYGHRGIQLFHLNGELWGRGYKNIGKVSLLPAVFGEDGTVQEYYLYIDSDFVFHPYSDFFYCTLSTFDVNPDKEQAMSGDSADYEPILHTFAVSSTARTWSEAKAICEAIGGHLATSTSEEKNAFLVSLIGNNTVWIGGSDAETEGAWKWVNGESWSYTNWSSGEPNNSGDEDYTELYPSGVWNDINGTTAHYYICEWDYEIKEKDFLGCLWPNIAVASVGTESLYGFVSKQADALSGGTCFKSADGHVLIPQTGKLRTLSENNAHLFFDVLNHTGLLLDDDGGQLMLGEGIDKTQEVNCKTLNQWLAPAEKIDAVTDGYIVASADNAAFCTSLVTGFNRQFLSPNTIPLTVRAFQASNGDYYRLTVSDTASQNNRKVFGVNKIRAQDVTPEAVQWEDVYREPVKIEFINCVEWPRDTFPRYIQPLLDDDVRGIEKLFSWWDYTSFDMDAVAEDVYIDSNGDFHMEVYLDSSHSYTSITNIYPVFWGRYFDPEDDPYPEEHEVNGYLMRSVSAKVILMNPFDGTFHEISISCPLQYSFETSREEHKTYTLYKRYVSRQEVPTGVGYTDNEIGFYGYVYGSDGETFFKPCASLPSFASSLFSKAKSKNVQPSIIFSYEQGNPDFIIESMGWKDKTKPCDISFQEPVSRTTFIQKSLIHQYPEPEIDEYDFIFDGVVTYPDYATEFIDDSGVVRTKQNLHFIGMRFEYQNTDFYWEEKYRYFLFRSELNPDAFDFYTKSERS